ncbi:MAG TPA: glycosyltransferase family 2 protein [Gammaproteobacteria bacterium]|nr:glycosyltransferase family 2 protein [Gammaproteobacteria bacterium]
MSLKLSVVIPTFHEVRNLEAVARAVEMALRTQQIAYEVIFVDDDSRDGSEALAAQLADSLPVRMIVRHGEKGLSTAVLHGIAEARGEIVVVMDADLSHPAERIPDMVTRLESGKNDFVVGSRYVTGGSLDPSWNWFRRLNSKVATWLALPLARIRDPMSGFFAFRRADMPEAHRLSPIGYKIGLELLVKGEFKKPGEVPIHFADRVHGESKLSWKEQVRYLRHLRRLYQYRFPFLAEFLQFGIVGVSGFAVDVLLYLGLQSLTGMGHLMARALSFWGAASWNWVWNRVLTFSNRQKTRKLVQWPSFLLTSLIGFAINVGSYYVLTHYVPFFESHKITALAIGVLLGFGFNFITARLLVFIPYEAELLEEERRPRRR